MEGRDVFTFEFFKDFFYMDHFLTSLFITILLLFLFGFFGHEACGISAPWPGIEPVPSTLEDKVSATGPAESPYL